MKFGTVFLHNKIYDIDYMKKSELEELFKNNNVEKTKEYEKAKNVCKRDNNEEEQYNVNEIPITFKSFLDNSSLYVKAEAIIYRAIVDKTSYDTVLEKVQQKRNSIKISINKINSNFNNSNKRYKEIQDNIDNSLKKYEEILKKLANFFDTKIEQLILRKLELEAHLIGTIINVEYLMELEDKKKEEKENDKLLISLSNSVKNIISKISLKKEKKEIDVTMLSKLQDKEDLKEEQDSKLKSIIEDTKNSRKSNFEKIKDYENQILSIENEIKRLNENKQQALIDAMESSSKEMIMSNNKKNFFGRIKIFFKSRINTANVIYENIINPFNKIIKDYEDNVLENIMK